MARPKPVTRPPSHHLDLEMSVGGEYFSLSGVFTLADGMAAFDRWVAKLGGNACRIGWLSQRIESLTGRIEL